MRSRIGELQRLRSEVSTSEHWYRSSEREKEKIPQYDVKAVDKKIAELEKFLYHADSKVKKTNATTEVEIDANVDSLLEPLQ